MIQQNNKKLETRNLRMEPSEEPIIHPGHAAILELYLNGMPIQDICMAVGFHAEEIIDMYSPYL